MAQDRYDVAVVGGGATGSATAWALARSGHRVVLVEERTSPADSGLDLVRLGHADPDRTRLALLTHQWWQILEQESGAELLTLTGCVEHGPVEALRPLVETLLVSDIPFEYLTGPEASLRWPWLAFDDRVVVQPVAGVADAGRTILTCQEQAALHGAEIRRGTRAVRVERLDDGVRVHVAGANPEKAAGCATIEAAAVVVAAGPASAELLAEIVELPSSRPVRDHRTQGASTEPVPGDRGPAFVHRVDAVAHGAARGPLGPDDGYPVDGVRGYHEPDGSLTVVSRTEDLDRTVLDEYVAAWLPGVTLADQPVPVTTRHDGPLVLDRLGRVVVGVGLGVHGVAFAPGAGHVLATLAEDALGHARLYDDPEAFDRAPFALTALVPTP
ncbi:FAD-dependent oxidoreductase [Cellulomonas sp.]|uniref:FAD-dependent oxidoreductase n=1 Tax=Cellulomonas sp. TaxID=40001 RepID=UPI001B00DCD0|nr:FAD-dependent oxidoreductase [Cellulomonas sp.]MBO9553387.1 FAD-dependent oxidoreductase [Cellulomonas sp.]